MRAPLAARTAMAFSFLEPMTAPTPERAAMRPFSFDDAGQQRLLLAGGPDARDLPAARVAQLGLQHVVGLVGVLAPQLPGVDQPGLARVDHQADRRSATPVKNTPS